MQSWLVLAQVAPSTPATSAPASTGTAQTVAPGAPATSQPGADKVTPPGPFGALGQFLPIILIVGVFYLFIFRGKNKDQKQQKLMLDNLKRGDQVMTIGGLIGSVVEVRGDQVVLKVDESNNVKEKYMKSAIQKVLVDDDTAENKK
jgi:preprotein translocase subunit YajC